VTRVTNLDDARTNKALGNPVNTPVEHSVASETAASSHSSGAIGEPSLSANHSTENGALLKLTVGSVCRAQFGIAGRSENTMLVNSRTCF
jgi:hypothetical protein